MIIDFTSDALTLNPVEGTYSAASIFAVSPTGSAAAAYYGVSKTVQVIGGLPHSPHLIQQFDASRIPGRGISIAISDDGSIALGIFAEAGKAALWTMDGSGAPRSVSSDQPSGVAFFPNQHNAIVTDDATQSAFVVMDVGNAATEMPLISADGGNSFSSVSASEDGQKVFLADANSGTITIVDMQTRTPTSLACQCQPTGFYQLKGTSVFQLTEPSSGQSEAPGSRLAMPSTHKQSLEPTMVLDAGSGVPRIVVIPPARTLPGTLPR